MSDPPATDVPETNSPVPASPDLDGLPSMTVGEALAAHAAGTLPDGRAAIRGFWTDGSIPHSCAASLEPLGELELYCHDGEFEITERDEPIWVVDRSGQVTYEAAGPHLTPWFPSGLAGAEELFSLPFINGQRYAPVPIVVIGHFDDPRADDCRAKARQLCRDRLVIDRIVQFDAEAVPTPGVTAPPTPFPSPAPSGLFDPRRAPATCRTSSWGGPRPPSWAWIGAGRTGTSGPSSRGMPSTAPTGSEQDDPNGSGHQYQHWARLICFAEESTHYEGEMGFESVPGTDVIHWDDGLITVGTEPLRPSGSH